MNKNKIIVGTSTFLMAFNMLSVTGFSEEMRKVSTNLEVSQLKNVNNKVDNSVTNITISKLTDRKIKVKYLFENKYGEKINLFLEDWALFPKNHKEYLGEVGIDKNYELDKIFNIVPSFNSEGGLSYEKENIEYDNTKKDTIYIADRNLGFAPTFYIKDTNGRLITTVSKTSTIDMEDLIKNMQQISKNIKIKASIPNKEIKVGEKIDIIYEITNNSNKKFDVKVQDGIYFGAGKESDLGSILTGKVNKFKKTITVTKDMITSDSKLIKGLPAFHFYDESGEAFVKKANIEYSDKSIERLFKSNIKVGYFKNYGIIIDGNITNELNEKFDKDVKKRLLVKGSGQANVKEFDVTNTDWYEKNNFSGYQLILTEKELSSLGNIKDAELYIQLEFENRLIEIPIMNNGVNKGKSWTSDYFYDLRKIPEIEIGSNKVKFGVSDKGVALLSNTIREGSLNMLSYYLNSKKEYVYDGELDSKLADDKYKKIYEVKKDGVTVHSGNVVKFADGIYPYVKSGCAIQVVVPKEFSTPEYTVSIVVKDSNDKIVERFTIPKYF